LEDGGINIFAKPSFQKGAVTIFQNPSVMANNATISDNGIYEYKPNQSATIVMAALFGVSAIYHLIVMIKKRTWFYIPLITGAISTYTPTCTWFTINKSQ
jgi:hypothetical protein